MRNAFQVFAAFVVLSSVALPLDLKHSNKIKRASLPVVFEENAGQAPPGYKFVSRHGGLQAYFASAGVEMLMPTRDKAPTKVRFHILGGKTGTVEADDALPSVSNYLVGQETSHWILGVPNYGRVAYRQIYSGIDLIFHGNDGHLEHDFQVAPHADPRRIRFSIDSAQKLSLDAFGNIEILLGGGKLVFRKPIAYQVVPNGHKPVECAFVVNREGSVRFQVGPYDRSSELIIDPVLVFSTYLAGSSADNIAGVTTDSQGNVYVTGFTNSLDFPTIGALQSTASGSPMAFVSKLDATGQTLLFSTYLGGSSRNYGKAIAIEANGNIIVAGTSSSNDFPHSGSVPSLTCSGNNDCYFLASLKPNGSAFNYSGLIGGIEGTAVQTGQSGSGSLALDSAGNAYLAGVTDDAHFQLTPGTLATSVPGYPYNSTFVLKAGPSGALVYSTIVPGINPPNITIYLNNVFIPSGISVDSTGRVTIAGTSGPGLPSTTGVLQGAFPNNLSVGNASAGFVLRLNATASAISYATYVPGTDTIGGLAVDGSGNSYVTGATSEGTLPVSSNAYQKTLKAGANCTCNSGFIAELNSTGTALLAATYLEGTPSTGNAGTSFTGIALDSKSDVFVGGMTGSSDFPMQNPFVSQWVYGTSVWDMVLAEMKPDLSSLLFGSFLSSVDQVFPASEFSAITVDSQDNLIVVGQTVTTDFPTTPGSYQRVPPTQARHGFVSKLDMTTPAASVCFDRWSVDFGSVPAKQSSTQTLHLTNCGNAPLSIASLVSSAATVTVQSSCSTVPVASVCPIKLSYAPVDSSPLTGTLIFSDDGAISTQSVQLSGQGQAPALSPSSGSFDFGHLLVNTSGAPTLVQFSNSGNASLVINSVSVSGDFTIAQNHCIGSISPGFFCSINVTFSPKVAGQRTGILTIASNDPVYPQAVFTLVGTGDSVYAVPQITSLGSPTAPINNGSITVQVAGTNFYPASVITVYGIPQPTTYLSGQQLQATLNSTITTTIGEIQISVSTPSPGGGTSTSLPLTLYTELNLYAAFLTSVPGSPLLYASIPASSPTNADTVISINPGTGSLGQPISVGHDPGLLAPSSDGRYLFVVANQDQTVQRIDLSTGTVDRTFAFPPNPICPNCGPQSAADLRAVPSVPKEVVLALSQVMALYNDQGMVNSIPTSSIAFAPNFSSFAFAGNPVTIYSLPFTLVQNSFFNIVTLSALGLGYTPLTGGNFGGNNTTGAQVVSDGTLLYTNSGQVWNPVTATKVGSFPVTTYNATSYPNLHSLLVDGSAGRIFLIGDEPYNGSSAIVLSVYNQSSLSLGGALAFPQVGLPLVNSLVRWGPNGIAFVGPSSTGSAQSIYVLKSSLVGPTAAAAGIGLGPAPGASTSATISPGLTATYYLTIGGAGLAGTANVSCTGAPPGMTCTVPGTITLDATASAALTVTVGTTSQASANPPAGLIPGIWAIVLFGFLLQAGSLNQFRPRQAIRLCLLLALATCSCGGGSSQSQSQSNHNGTPPGTYTLTVTASTTGGSQSVPLTLTVQ